MIMKGAPPPMQPCSVTEGLGHSVTCSEAQKKNKSQSLKGSWGNYIISEEH